MSTFAAHWGCLTVNEAEEQEPTEAGGSHGSGLVWLRFGMAQVWYGSAQHGLTQSLKFPHFCHFPPWCLVHSLLSVAGKVGIGKGTHLKRPSNGRPNHHIAGRRKICSGLVISPRLTQHFFGLELTMHTGIHNLKHQ